MFETGNRIGEGIPSIIEFPVSSIVHLPHHRHRLNAYRANPYKQIDHLVYVISKAADIKK